VSWLRCQKIFWPRVLSSDVIQFYAGECTPSLDKAKDQKAIFAQEKGNQLSVALLSFVRV